MLDGKRAAVFGVANEHSLAWAIARSFHEEGARVALSHAGTPFEKRVRPLAERIGSELVFPCDVREDGAIVEAANRVGEAWGRLDILVHSIAFAERSDLQGRFVDTGREGFRTALEVSVYSLVALARAFEGLMGPGAILTLTYIGSRRVVPNYNVMGVAKAALEASVRYLAHDLGRSGIRVNAISAGPVRTLSAAGVRGFRDMLRHHAEVAPLRRNVSAEEVARGALYLCSDLASGVTGEVLYVDAGYHVLAR